MSVTPAAVPAVDQPAMPAPPSVPPPSPETTAATPPPVPAREPISEALDAVASVVASVPATPAFAVTPEAPAAPTPAPRVAEPVPKPVELAHRPSPATTLSAPAKGPQGTADQTVPLAPLELRTRYRFNGIFKGDAGSFAIINGTIMGPGDELDEHGLVKEVGEKHVLIEFDGTLYRLRMH